MRSIYLKTMKTAVLAVAVLLLGATVALAQQQVNVTAAGSTLTMPDGSAVPMWGYTCSVTGPVAAGTQPQTCGNLSPNTTGWSPIVITVPTGQTLNILLTNNLSFPTTAGPYNVPTSLVIVGQLGGNLGTSAKLVNSP